jgi:P4 family phage/plasmid primase-like protien
MESVAFCPSSVQYTCTENHPETHTEQGFAANSLNSHSPIPDSPQSTKGSAALDPIAHFQQEFCQGSGIAPELYAAAVAVRDELEVDPHTHEALGYPIHEALGWQPPSTQYQTRKPHRFIAGAFLLQETGEVWQIKPLTPRDDRDGKPVKYETPRGSGSRVYLPPINPETLRAICHRHGLDFDTVRNEVKAIGSFWKWVARRPELPIVLTEGGKTALSPLSHGFIVIALTGCWGATRITDSNGDRLDKPVLIEDLQPFAVTGRHFTIALDVDLKPTTIATVKKANRRTTQVLLAEGCTVSIALWNNDDGQAKGVDDLIVHRGIEAWEQALAEAQPTTLELTPIPDWAILSQNSIARGPQNVLADHLQEKIGDRLCWNVADQTWLRYNAKPLEFPGLWLPIKAEFVQEIIRREFEWMNSELDLLASEREDVYPNTAYTARQIDGVCAQLRMRLACNRFETGRNILPFQNGILDVATGKFKQGHQPTDRLTWQLPYSYDPEATCDPILEWMEETTGGDRLLVELLRAYLKAVLMGRADLQRYLEIIGPGGTGKSTFTRLAQALVGYQNTHATTLKELESNRFEAANLVGKRLILVADSDRWGGTVSQLKCITGGDPIRVERKWIQESESVAIAGMVILTANEMIQTSDYTSGLQRRRLTVPFLKQVDPAKQVDLISVSSWGISGLFADYLPGLVNWVLGCDDATMHALVKDTARHVPSLDRWRNEALLDSNPMAAWLDDRIELCSFAREKVGLADSDESSSLYANYCAYMRVSGANPVSLRRFSNLLEDLIRSHLKIQGVEKGRDRFGAYFSGIKIRNQNSTADRIITGAIEPLPVTTEPTPDDLPVAIAPEPEPEPLPVTSQPIHDDLPVAIAPEPEPEPLPVTSQPIHDDLPVAIAPEPEPEPLPVTSQPIHDDLPVAIAPEPEPLPEPTSQPSWPPQVGDRVQYKTPYTENVGAVTIMALHQDNTYQVQRDGGFVVRAALADLSPV